MTRSAEETRTPSTKSAESSPSTAIPTPRARPISRSTPCSIAGQESAGIATADYTNLANIKGMGLVADIFTDEVLAKLPGEMAIGHTRYSTTGDSALLNAQPIRVDSTKGLIAIAHNGNLVNLGNVRTRLERDGRFLPDDQRLRDHRAAHCPLARRDAGRRHRRLALPGGGSFLDRHDDPRPHLRRPRSRAASGRLSMGRITNPDGPDTIVFASETCAFDLLRAKWERDVKPGELVMVTQDGVTSRQYSTGVPQTSCIFEHVYFRPARQPHLRPLGAGEPRPDGPPAGPRIRRRRRSGRAGSGLGRDRCARLCAESGIPFNFGLIRNHYVGRTFIEPEQRVRDFGVKLKLNPMRNLLEGQTDHPDRRLGHSRHDESEKSCAWSAPPARPRFICASAVRRRFHLAFMGSIRRASRS